MGFFKKMFASVGIGSAKVDTVVETENIFPSGEIEGYIDIKGGSTPQKIDEIYLNVFAKYTKEYTVEDERGEEEEHESKISHCIQKYKISINREVQEKEHFSVPFSFTLIPSAPISTANFPLWIHTGLDIKMAIDPTDKDYLDVIPHPYLNTVFGALENLGFFVREIENEYSKSHYGGFPFVQEIEFQPTTLFRDRLDELEIIYFIKENGIDIIMEIDRKARGLMGGLLEMLDLDETTTRLYISEDELNEGVENIAQIIHDFLENKI